MAAPTSTTHLTFVDVPGNQKVAVLTMDSPPVNSLSRGTRAGLVSGVEKALADKSVVGIIVRGAGRAFCAGAEITEFAGAGNIKEEPLTDTIARLENCKIPVVALVHGFALGGGFEVALSTHYRLATSDAQFGLPEVNLGLLPGAGGTQRLPRLIGAVPSAEMILSGAPIKAEKALKLGVVDAIVKEKSEEGRLKEAVDFLLTKKGQPRPVAGLTVPDAKDPEVIAKLDSVYKTAMQKRRGEFAPSRIIDCVKASVQTTSFKEGMAVEGRLFGQLLASPEARAMQHVFFAERAAAKLPKEFNVEPAKIKKVGVIGSGTMGGGIAMCCVDVGMSVILIDATQEFLDRGMSVIKKNYSRSVERKSITQALMDKRLALIQPSLNYADLKDCDIVVEAVFENMQLKKEIFAKLDAVCKPGCVLATNTSGLNIDEIAASTKRPQDVIGAHFFSPANVMRLLENVKGAASSPRTISTAMDFGKRIGKVAILVGNCPGFVGNRMLGSYTSEAEKLALEGAPIEKIDAVARNVIGMNQGPFAMNDLVGLDVFWRKRKTEGKSDPNKIVADALCEAGRYGQKNGKGFYQYKDGRTPESDPLTHQIITKVAENLRVSRRSPEKISEQEIFERLMYPLINEGFKCLEEKMAYKSSDVDVCYVFGYGFPRWRGGPMKLAEELGFDTVLAGLNKYRRWGNKEQYWTPSNLLEKLVAEKKSSLAKL